MPLCRLSQRITRADNTQPRNENIYSPLIVVAYEKSNNICNRHRFLEYEGTVTTVLVYMCIAICISVTNFWRLVEQVQSIYIYCKRAVTFK